ncbi:MAG: NAD(P)/FAD-dependent oxidoreductase [Candidatus Nomurabacteria bacterium]|nr:MAG: NAD(P)/FAD-dependent oxidoreductase [Candidatus Nomurabacteria bacterium]HRV76130.1 NAD(P)/FAD-dependent oxidoreductase [Candidatus Saccharimonadales bacterium]
MAKKQVSAAEYNFDTIIIGSGPAGSTAAELLAHGGQRVAIVEAERLGGECLNYGCVPTKSMLAAAHLFRSVKNQKAITNAGLLKLRINKLVSLAENNISKTGANELGAEFKKLGITVLEGRAYFLDNRYIDVGGEKYSAHNFIIATGGEVAIPNIPGLDGLDYLTYKNFLTKIKEKAPRSVTIIGGGAVGCEYAQVLSATGAKVNIVECAERLVSDQEPEASEALQKNFEKIGVKVYLRARVVAAHPSSTGNLKEVELICPKDGQIELKTDSIMVAAGKKMRDGGDGLGNAGIHCESGLIKTNSHCQTEQSHIYAIGDTTGPYRLTSTAIQQASIAAFNILRPVKKNLASVDHAVTPSCIFTFPEVAKVGESTVSLKKRGIKFISSYVKLSEVTRSKLEDDLDGFVKLWADPSSKIILGACLVGPSSSEQISSLALAVRLKATAHQLADLTQVFPTWSEAISLAASEL